jgi:two-component system, chemotaxis family, chemotaxis protein CheY
MKILVVDDSATFRSQMRRTLEGAGYQVIEAEDGIAGLDALAVNQDVALILCDLNMPRLDGLGMCERIHKESKGKHAPMVMLTTESSIESKNRGKAAGVIAWIIKPHDDEKLLAAIRKITGK